MKLACPKNPVLTCGHCYIREGSYKTRVIGRQAPRATGGERNEDLSQELYFFQKKPLYFYNIIAGRAINALSGGVACMQDLFFYIEMPALDPELPESMYEESNNEALL